MSGGYQAGALHHLSYVDLADRQSKSSASDDRRVRFREMVIGLPIDPRPVRFRSPTVAEIVAWRRGIADKYRDQLGDALAWDEDDPRVEAEDVASSDLLCHLHAAALLDITGPAAAAAALRGAAKQAGTSLWPAVQAAQARGFAGRFPHLLLGATVWLPHQRPLMIEEPDWNGAATRFGSVVRLAAELAEIGAFIAETDPGAAAWNGPAGAALPDLLTGAWQAHRVITRLCGIAVDRACPLVLIS